MGKYQKNFIVITTILVLGFGLFSVNINLNRQIYASIVGENTSYTNNKEVLDLDRMQQVLDNPRKYKISQVNNIEDEDCVPEIRVLFTAKPFDFRIDTNNYVFFINKEAIPKLETEKLFYQLKRNTFKLKESISDKLGIIYNMG